MRSKTPFDGPMADWRLQPGPGGATRAGFGARSVHLFLIVSLCVALSDAAFVVLNDRLDRRTFQRRLDATGEIVQATFLRQLDADLLHLKDFATYVANDPVVQDLIAAGARALADEGAGSVQPEATRGRLWDRVAPSWEAVSREDGLLRGLGFYLGPDGVAFLRRGVLDGNGEGAADVPPIVRRVIAQGAPARGFDWGGGHSHLRGVVPIPGDRGSDESSILGAVEVQSSFADLLDAFGRDMGIYLAVVMTIDQARQTLSPAQMDTELRKRVHDERFLVVTSASAEVEALLSGGTVGRLADRPGTQVVEVAGRRVAVTGFPLRDDAGGPRAPSSPVGMVLAWRDAAAEAEAFEEEVTANIAYGVAAFLVVQVLLTGLWWYGTRRLWQVIEHQTWALSEAQRIGRLGHWEHDLATGRLEWSDEVFNIFGLDRRRHDMSYAAFLDLVHPDDRQEVHQAYAASLEQKTPYRITHRLVRPDGTVRYVEEACEHTLDKNGKLMRSLGTVQDITDRIRAEEDLKAAKEQAEAANRSKTDFLATMSHEVRTPMSSLLGMAELLRETSLDEVQREYVEVIGNAGAALLSLTNDILDISKIEADELQLETVPFDVREVVEGAVRIMRPQAAKKGLELRYTLAQTVATARCGDPQRIRQILLNLIGNAVKFTERGGVSVGVEELGERLEFSVTDTGTAIPADIGVQLFQPFSRADVLAARRGGGSGLGLHICRRLVERMGGQIGVKSTPGEGNTFYFSLALPPEEAPVALASAEPAPSPGDGEIQADQGQGPCVLVVDDSRENRLMIERFLTLGGYRAVGAENGGQALARVLEGGVDLVLMDLEMPVMNGFEAARAIRSWERRQGLARTPILMLSAHAMKGHAEESLEIGCDDYLTKPIRKQQLLDAIGRIAGRISGAVAAGESPPSGAPASGAES